MKKILLIAILLIGFVSCNDYLDVNKDPNNPTRVENNLLIPSAQNFIASVVGGDMHNMASFFVQYCDQKPESNQYNELTEYSFNSALFNRSYSNIYAGGLRDLEVIRNQASESGRWGDYFLATVLRAYTFQIVVDYMDKIPYSEAAQGNKYPMPKWESGEDVYNGILAEMDYAQSKVTGSSTISADMMLDGNINRWIQFANALRLRIYMRASSVQNNEAKIKSLITENNFFTGDVKFAAYSDEASKRNPWYETNNVKLTKNHVAALPIVSYMLSTSDPRIDYIFEKATKTKTFEGAIPGSKAEISNNKNEMYSGLVYDPIKPVYLYTQSELQFFLAEAYLLYFNDDAKAKAAYENAVDANFTITRGFKADKKDDPSPNSLIGFNGTVAWNKATTNAEKMKLIGMQKWVALCMINNTEAWSEARRLDIPNLSASKAQDIYKDITIYIPGNLISPWVNALGHPNLIKSIFYPQTAINLNSNTPVQRDLKTPVWWDKK